jgi:xylulokinase
MGVMLSAAGSLQWYRDTLAPGASFDELLAEAEAVPAGSEGLLFLPYLSGERTPYPDPLARGAWVGMTVRHGRGHLTRAVLEGVAFGMRDGFALLEGMGLDARSDIRLSGGGARGALWQRIVASVLDAELSTVSASEGAAYGAALLAGVGADIWPDVAAATSGIAPTGRVTPDPHDARIYAALYPPYRALYPALRPTFDSLAAF